MRTHEAMQKECLRWLHGAGTIAGMRSGRAP